MNYLTDFENYVRASRDTKNLILNDVEIKKSILKFSELALATIKSGGKLIFAGNGGSFADAQHLTAEFVSRFMFDRRPLPAIALGTNSSNLSAIANDYGFVQVFARELSSIASRKDLFIPISTSGNSENILMAVSVCDTLGVSCFGLTGENSNKLSNAVPCIKVPSKITAHIQECHIMIGHYVCKYVEHEYFKNDC